MCGGDLNIENGISVAECDYCGTKQTVPTANDEGVQTLFNRANTLRTKCEFDKAEKLYEKIIQTDETQCEAYWGLILCKYGIEYVEDPKTFNRIPTCHRTSYDSIIADDDYKSALEFADSLQRAVYEAEAKEIDRIQKEILELSKNEEPYDVFICYKETDSSGQRTPDNVIANDIYYQLTEQGFKVFYAAITLEDKLGSAYEPCIFAALNSAKVMLSIGTKPEYFNAVWVKNEWSRFLKIIEKDRTKVLIPCYRDMDAYELPEEFAHLQAQDMSKIGFINDLIRGIKKIIDVQSPNTTVVKETVIDGGNASTAPLLKRAFMFLEDGDWSSADEYCEKVLDIDPECAEAYLGKLMVELKVNKKEDLKDQAEPFDDNNNYQKAVRFARESLKTSLIGYTKHINQKIANKQKDEILAKGKSYLKYETIYLYEAAIELFESISGYKDADEQLTFCKKQIEEIREKEKSNQIKKKQRAKERLKKCKKISVIATPIICATIAFTILLNTSIMPNIKYNKAINLMESKKFEEALILFKELDNYKNSDSKIAECNTAVKDIKYTEAISLMNNGNFDKAYNIFQELGDYKDCLNKAGNIRLNKNKKIINSSKVGDYIFFGTYEQDDNTSNGTEDIEWLVLKKEEKKALIISKYAIDSKQYNTTYTFAKWDNCSLRKWLNNSFLNSAFSKEEMALIQPDNITKDQIFLLSASEAKTYFNNNNVRQCIPTDYATAKGIFIGDNGYCCWWLRSRDNVQHYEYNADIVNALGNYGDTANVNDSYIGIRPVLWISLE